MTPTTAYDLLDENERYHVDDYLAFILSEQHRRKERIALALGYPIAPERVRASRGVLARPLVRAAVAERIRDEGEKQDLSPNRLIAHMSGIAFSNLHDYLIPQPFGDFALRNLNDIPYDKMAAVKSIESKPGLNGNHVKITMHDKIQSQKMLAELMGLVAPDRAPVLEDYSRSARDEKRQMLEAPESLYSEILDGDA